MALKLHYDVPDETPIRIMEGHTYYGEKADNEYIEHEYSYHFQIRATWGDPEHPDVTRLFSITKGAVYCGDAKIKRLDTDSMLCSPRMEY